MVNGYLSNKAIGGVMGNIMVDYIHMCSKYNYELMQTQVGLAQQGSFIYKEGSFDKLGPLMKMYEMDGTWDLVSVIF